MKNKFIIASIVCLGMLSTTSCKKEEKTIDPTSTTQQGENGNIELFPNAKVVSDTENKNLTSVTEESLTFTGSSDFFNSIKVGDILMSGTSELAPDGYLRSVNSIEKNGNTVVFHTSNSSLEKAIKNGNIHVEFPIMFNANEDLETGKTSALYTNTQTKTIPLNHILYDKDGNKTGTLYDQISTNGSLVFSATMSIDMNFSWGSLNYFDAKTTFAATNSQTLTMGGTLTIPQKTVKMYGNTSIPSVNFVISGVPVNIKPYVDVYVDYGGSVTAQAKFGYKGQTSYTPEIKYQNGSWKYLSVKSASLVGYKPNVNLSANFSASLRPRITFALYGCQSCASAYLQASVYGDLDCTLSPTITKKVSGGVKLGAGATLFGYHVDNDSFYNYSFPI